MPYSIKMRASQWDEDQQKNKHISGAERMIPQEEIHLYVTNLIDRALNHSKGKPDFINIKIEEVKEEEVLHLPALPVTECPTHSPEEGRKAIIAFLEEMGLKNGEAIMDRMTEAFDLRGAILLNVDTMQRLEPNQERGIRATYMDAAHSEKNEQDIACKNHYKEAIVLATKVANAPHILGEICISDDPDYVTGYFSSKEKGYVRIRHIKEMGSPKGGRIFLYRGREDQVQETIDFLQQQHVIVEHIHTEAVSPTS